MLNAGVRLCPRIATTAPRWASAWPIRWLPSFHCFHSGRGLVAASAATASTPAESVRRWAYLTDVEGNLNFFQGAVRQSDALTYDAHLCEPYAPAGHRSCGHFCMPCCFQCHLPSHASTSTHSNVHTHNNALANTHIHRHTNSSIFAQTHTSYLPDETHPTQTAHNKRTLAHSHAPRIYLHIHNSHTLNPPSPTPRPLHHHFRCTDPHNTGALSYAAIGCSCSLTAALSLGGTALTRVPAISGYPRPLSISSAGTPTVCSYFWVGLH